MKKYGCFILLLLFISSCSQGDGPDMPPPPLYNVVDPVETTEVFAVTPAEKDVLARLNKVGVEYMDLIAPDDKAENYCVSPLSLNLAVALVANSVSEERGQSVARNLGFESLEQLNSMSHRLISYLAHPSPARELAIANAVWHSASYTPSEEFVSGMASVFGAPVTPFIPSTNEAVDMINSWIYDTSQGMIPSILESASDSFYWSNTIFFRSEWFYNFDPADTTVGTFHGNGYDSDVSMMHALQSNSGYAKAGDDIYALIRFGDHDYSFELIISEKPFTYELYNELRMKIGLYDIELSLPRFSVSTCSSIGNVLSMLGLDASCLDGMGLPDVHCSAFSGIQKTRIDIDEQGAKLAASTLIGGVGGPPVNPKVSLTVDRPFIFIVREAKTDAIILAGRINNL